jgi:hypothetical protein
MTPKEKAEELLWKFNPNGIYWDVENVWIGSSKSPEFIKRGIAQSCKYPAIIAVDEILTNNMYFKDANNDKYWNDVKKEIEAL